MKSFHMTDSKYPSMKVYDLAESPGMYIEHMPEKIFILLWG